MKNWLDGLTDKGFNYNGAWGGPAQNGGRLEYENELMSKVITERNKDKNFVQRALNPNDYPHIVGDNNKRITHLMGYGTDNEGNAYASPNVIQNKLGLLSHLTEEDAVQYSKDTGEYIKFPEEKLAEYYTRQGLIKHQNGGSVGGTNPGSVGFTYARTGAPSNGKYAKKTLPSAQYGDIIDDDMGQWAHPGEITRINSNNITMQGVNYPVLGISDTGDRKLMKPGKNYKFKGNSVTEYPKGKNGTELTKLDQLTNFTNYNDEQPGGWLDQYEEGGWLDSFDDGGELPKLPRELTPKAKVKLPGVTKESLLKPKTKVTSEQRAQVQKAFPVPKTGTELITDASKDSAVKQQEQFEVDVKQERNKEARSFNNRSNNLDVEANKVDDIISSDNLTDENAVKKVQQNLIRLGYNLNPEGKFANKGVDGKLGKVTMKAIQEHNQKGGGGQYVSYKQGEGMLGKCTETQCSEYAQNEVVRNLKPNVDRPTWNKLTGTTGNAWEIGKNIVKAGGSEVPINQVKSGDFVTIYTGVQTYMKKAKAAGTDATHVGVVDQVNPDGSYYILHNTHVGSKEKGYEGREYRTLVKPDGKLNLKNYAVRNAYSPNYDSVKDFEQKTKVRDDVRLTFNPTYEKKLKEQDKSIGSKVGIGADMHKRINTYLAPINDVKTKQTMATKHNLSETDYQSVAQVAMGILKQESGLGTSSKAPIKEVVGAAAKLVGLKSDEVSKGAGRVKFETNYGKQNLSEFGIDEDNFTDDDKMPVVVMDIIAKHYKGGVEQGLSKEDAMYRAIEKYNKGRMTKTAEEKQSVYVNDVLAFAEGFQPKDRHNVAYNTHINKLNLNDKVVTSKVLRKN